MKRNALAAATEAACLILSVDETARNPPPSSPTPELPRRPRMGG